MQIIPARLDALLAHPDREKAVRATLAMLEMKKIDVAAAEATFNGA